MIVSAENILLIGSVLLFASIIASKTSFRFGVPTLVLFIVVGMLAGSDGPGGIYFNDPHLAEILGVIALNFILFSGGMDTHLKETKPILYKGIALSTLGVLITAVSVGLFASYITELNILEGLLLGAIVSSTDAAAVFSILRTRNIKLKNSLGPTLELESGSNDPMAYFLTISLIQLVQQPDQSIGLLILGFFRQMLLGALAGWLMGRVIVFVLNKIKLEVDGLYPVLLLSLMFFTFSATDLIKGNGFLAVYIAGILVGNSDFIHKKSLLRFYDGQAWLMQIIMFLTLGLLVFPKQLLPLAGTGLLLALFLIFISRPLGVFISLAFFKTKLRSKFFLSWVGLRGAVPIIFATYPLLAGLEHAQFIFNLVFFISLTSVLFQGTTLPIVAKWLKVIESSNDVKTELPVNAGTVFSNQFNIVIPQGSKVISKSLWQIGFPEGSSIIAIKRAGEIIIPQGNTSLLAQDELDIVVKEPGGQQVIEKMIYS